ncbi:MAG TPA: site-specific integrase [Chloroflexota bacterium]|nr:site-specific integrase [Chloroflexota bacterium]
MTRQRVRPEAAGGAVVQLSLFDTPPAESTSQALLAPLPVSARDATTDAATQATVVAESEERDQPQAEEPRRPVPRPQAVTLRGAIEEYKEYLVALNRSKHTRESFALDLKLLLEHLGDVPLITIGERELRSFISHVRLQRKNNATSVRRKVASLKNFFSYLHRERAIASDPSLRLIYPEIYPALPEFLEDPQADALLVAASEHLAWHALIALMLETGLKRDEVVALGRADVQLASGESLGSYLVVRETEQAKRLRSRRLEIDVEVADLLRRFLSGEPPRERFFDFSPRGVNFIVETCGKRARIVTRGPRLTPQVLRETFAVRHMRALVAEEHRLRAADCGPEALALLIEQHDIQLLRLLGLHEEPESAKKYRKLVYGWTESGQP